MPLIELVMEIRAPMARVFDLSRSIDLHMTSTAHTGERAVGGVTSGLIGPGEEVTWRARHFWVWQHLTSRITAYDRPHHFRDSMVRGAFRRFDHDHHFETRGDVTLVRERFDFDAPFGPLGRLVSWLVLTRYMHNLLAGRNLVIKEAAETEAWRRYLPPEPEPGGAPGA